MLLIVGLIFDLLGRKIFLFLLLAISSASLYLIPKSAPNLTLYIILSSILSIFMAAAFNAPLGTDYFKKEDLGKGTALAMMGYQSGIIFSMLVVFAKTKDMDPSAAFAISASLVAFTAILTLFMVKEPTDVKIEKPNLNKLCRLVKKSFLVMLTKREVFLGYFNLVTGSSDMPLNVIYLQAWLNSLIGTKVKD